MGDGAIVIPGRGTGSKRPATMTMPPKHGSRLEVQYAYRVDKGSPVKGPDVISLVPKGGASR